MSIRSELAATNGLSSSRFRDIAAVMAKAPQSDAPIQARADWLWALSDALEDIGLEDLAETARDSATRLVSDLIDLVTGGESA